ncbi:PREDICTED: wall-associated receptor kinase 3-like [Fragaria vesca subsp. vesca]
MKDIKSKIMLKVRQELEENRDVDVDQDLISILPLKLQNRIKSCMPFTRLKQVPLLQKMDERILKAICRELTPVMYTNNNIIVRENAPLQVMLFIVDGVVVTEKNFSKLELRAGDIYGEKLLVWPSLTSFPDKLPPAADSARAVGDVEALVLRFEDMEILGSKLRRYFRKYSKYCTLEEQLTKIHVGRFEEALKIFTTQELKKATNNFDHSRIIGEGGYGEVYKGILPDRTEVAIKRFKRSVHQSEKFVQEVTALSKVSHRHVVRLLGYCIETESPSLILEYIPNGSLYEHIHDKSRGPTLSFKVRMRIAAETAGALAYMHSLPVSIIHGDVKSANILLDDNYSAKVMDFGTSQGHPDNFTHITTNVCGTFGYLDPEYFMRCTITERSDVYSFGVVLAELLTSRKAVSRDRPEREVHLAEFLKFTAREGHLDQIFDHEIVTGGNIRAARKVAHLACRCLQMNGVDRPSMKEVATELELFLECIENHPEEEEEEEDQLESTPSISRTSTFPIEHDDYMLRLDAADVNTDIDDESDDDDDSSHSWVR